MTRGTVSNAASKGHRQTLVALRNRLAAEIDAEPGARDLAGLVKQLTDVLAKLAALDPPKAEVSASDDIAKRRAARREAATGP